MSVYNGFSIGMDEAVYSASDLAIKVRQTGQLAIFDLDGTYTGPPEVRKSMRRIAQEKGFGEVFGSARTPELMITEEYRQVSLENAGLRRPPPLCGEIKGSRKRRYQPLETVPLCEHLLNPDAVISFGVGNFVRAKGVYHWDEEYDRTLGYDWRSIVLSFLQMRVDPTGEMLQHLVPLDNEENYPQKLIDVAPLPHRIGFQFFGPNGLERKLELKRRITELQKCGQVVRNGVVIPGSPIAASIMMVDESHPEASRYTLYLVPRQGTKEKAYNRLLRQTIAASGKRNDEIELFIAGDTLTDFKAGCYLGWWRKQQAVRGTFLLAGGSRLSEYLVGKKRGELFAGESLKRMVNRFKKAEKTNHPGVYRFMAPWSGGEFRRIIIADEAFPGTIAVESLLAYFQSDLCFW